MRAARSDSLRITSSPRFIGVVAGEALRQPLGPRQDGRQRVVQLVRHARDGLAERRHLLGLQQLVVEVARLILEVLALADVADERLDAHCPGGVGRVGGGGHLEPDRRAVGLAQAQQVVGDRPGARQAIEKGGARLLVGEARGVEGPDLALDGLRRIAEDQLQMRDWRRGWSSTTGRAARCTRPRVPPRRAGRTPPHDRRPPASVLLGGYGRRRRLGSVLRRPLRLDRGADADRVGARVVAAASTRGPRRRRWRSRSRACPTRSTLPLASRLPTKHISLLRWPSASQPQ